MLSVMTFFPIVTQIPKLNWIMWLFDILITIYLVLKSLGLFLPA